jgi:hypothetical protein
MLRPPVAEAVKPGWPGAVCRPGRKVRAGFPLQAGQLTGCVEVAAAARWRSPKWPDLGKRAPNRLPASCRWTGGPSSWIEKELLT